jgi:hypothetical protein
MEFGRGFSGRPLLDEKEPVECFYSARSTQLNEEAKENFKKIKITKQQAVKANKNSVNV